MRAAHVIARRRDRQIVEAEPERRSGGVRRSLEIHPPRRTVGLQSASRQFPADFDQDVLQPATDEQVGDRIDREALGDAG